MKRSYLLAAIIAIAASGWIASGQFSANTSEGNAASKPRAAALAHPPAPPRVRVRAIRAVAHTNQLTLFGRTEALRKVKLMAETSGRVILRAVKKGGRVEKGDEIVRLAMDDRLARLAEAEAALEQRRIAHDADLKLSQKQFRSKVKLAASRAALVAATAALKRIRLDIERTVIRAPFKGLIDELPLEIGDYAAIKTAVASIVDLDTILIVGEVSERNIAKIRVGAPARVSLSSGVRTDGVVRYVSKVGSQATRTFRIEVEIQNPGNAIAEGLTSELRLNTGTVKAHHLSPAALTLSDAGVVGVKTVNAANEVEFFPIRIIADTPAGIWLTGLPDSATLITVGQEFVLPGQVVEPVHEAEGTKS